jgi:hypothetical protein
MNGRCAVEGRPIILNAGPDAFKWIRHDRNLLAIGRAGVDGTILAR